MKTMSRRRSGFTLLEVTLVSGLTVFLAVMLSSTWVLFSRPTAELIAFGHLFQEMDVAVASLTRDLGGSLPNYRNASGQPGGRSQGCLLECRRVNDTNGDHLQLCFDGGDNPNGQVDWGLPTNDTLVDYYVDGGSHTLIRSEQAPGTTFTTSTSFKVARNVDSLQITDGGNTLQITLTFKYPKVSIVVPEHGTETLTRTCTLITKKSP
jgi:hypothetical protein